MISRLSSDLNLKANQVSAAVELLQAGNTVPFIARYRKEATGSLDEVQIRAVEERLGYLKDLESRRKTILDSVESQGKLSDALRNQILACDNKATLEDIYLPYKPKRRTRAMMAREKGLEPLAELMMTQPLGIDPSIAALPYVNAEKEVADVAAALAGARDIVAEIVAETAEVRAHVRKTYEERGSIVSKKRDDVQGPTKFEQYYEFKEPLS